MSRSNERAEALRLAARFRKYAFFGEPRITTAEAEAAAEILAHLAHLQSQVKSSEELEAQASAEHERLFRAQPQGEPPPPLQPVAEVLRREKSDTYWVHWFDESSLKDHWGEKLYASQPVQTTPFSGQPTPDKGRHILEIEPNGSGHHEGNQDIDRESGWKQARRCHEVHASGSQSGSRVSNERKHEKELSIEEPKGASKPPPAQGEPVAWPHMPAFLSMKALTEEQFREVIRWRDACCDAYCQNLTRSPLAQAVPEGRYLAQICYHGGCQWREQRAEIERLRKERDDAILTNDELRATLQVLSAAPKPEVKDEHNT